MTISIHALLAESDGIGLVFLWWGVRFLSTLSLRRATFITTTTICTALFLSTLSLRRATWLRCWQLAARDISIHALLAESDQQIKQTCRAKLYFYPRSPCGERPSKSNKLAGRNCISIHALLAESDVNEDRYGQQYWRFLSTLSLRRATPIRSEINTRGSISIHALLAESDARNRQPIFLWRAFLSTLSLRRATMMPPSIACAPCAFLSTLSLRRATLGHEEAV